MKILRWNGPATVAAVGIRRLGTLGRAGVRRMSAGGTWRGWLLLALVAGVLGRMVYVGRALLLACPTDRARIVLFAGVALLVTWSPGIFLRRWLRVRSSNLFLDVTFVLSSGLCGSALLAWILYGLGIYTRSVLVIGLVVLALGGIYGVRGSMPTVLRFRASWTRAADFSFLEWLTLAGGVLLSLGLFEQVVGTPMVSWDAITSWDKWAVDAGQRPALGRYAMGGYPQFLPMLGSVFYKLAGSGAAVFPIEHLLLHGFYVHFMLLLVFALLALGRMLGFPGGILLVLLFGNGLVFEMTTENIGLVDIPFVAVLCAACALGFAYVRGIWRTAPGGWRDSAALFLPLYAVPFMKGNGLPWLIVLVVALGAELRLWRRIRLVGAPFLAALAMSMVYMAHQIWFGAWHWDGAEPSPFLRSHTFVAAHTKEFTLDWAHLIDWMERIGAAWNITVPRGGELLVAVLLLLCVWAARDRRLRFFAIAGPLGLAVWFFTASYDFRNAAAPLAMALVAVVGVFWPRRLQAMGWAHVCLIPTGVLVAATLWSLNQLRVLTMRSPPVGRTTVFMHRRAAPESLFALPFQTYRVPIIVQLAPDRRHMGVRPWGDIREILFRAPFGKRAAHLLAADGMYRVLSPRGVYMMHKNRYQGQQRFDVALGEPYLKPSAKYEKVSRLRRVGLYNVPVRLFKPEFEAVEMWTEDAPRDEILGAAIKAGEARVLRFKCLAEDSSRLKEGILSLTLSPPDAKATLSLSARDSERDPYSAYFESVRQGASLRLLYWMNDDRPDLPEFVLQAGSNDLRIVAAEWGQ